MVNSMISKDYTWKAIAGLAACIPMWAYANAITTAVTVPSTINISDDPVVFSLDGEVTGSGTAFSFSGSSATPTGITVNNTTAAKEINVAGRVFDIGLSSGAAPIHYTVGAGAVVEGTQNLLRLTASSSLTGTFTLNNSGTMTCTNATYSVNAFDFTPASAMPFEGEKNWAAGIEYDCLAKSKFYSHSGFAHIKYNW